MNKIKLPDQTPAHKAEILITKHGQEDAEKNVEQIVYLALHEENRIYEYWSKVLEFVKKSKKLKIQSGI
jgi:DNA polymerase IIIc chi subunit